MEDKINNLEILIKALQKEIQILRDNIYVFSDRQEWKKKLKVPTINTTDLNIDNDISVAGDLSVTGDSDFTGAIKAAGTPGTTTSFSTAATLTVTVNKGLITSVV